MLGLVSHLAGFVLGAPHLGLRIMRVLPLSLLVFRPVRFAKIVGGSRESLKLGASNAFVIK